MSRIPKPLYSPGPWSDDNADHDAPYQDLKIRNAHGHTICTIRFDDAPVHDYNREQVANAMLIKASPDLVAAVPRLLALIDALMPGLRHISIQDYAELNEAPIDARRALAKAHGLK